jgi:hypothetical protein
MTRLKLSALLCASLLAFNPLSSALAAADATESRQQALGA